MDSIYISALEHARMLKLSSYFLLGSINTAYKYCHAWIISEMYVEFHLWSINRYMAEWIESWDLEAMTSFNREIGVRGPVGTSKLEFFHPGFTPTVFLH